MLFSILIANYNNGHFFKDCYKSILKQTYKNWEVIIVDDGSTDASFEVIKAMVCNDSRFNIFQNAQNRGCGYTKRKCVQYARGEVLGFLDPDDAIKADALEVMINKHKENKQAAIITSKYEFVDLDMNFKSTGLHGSSIPKGKSYLTFGEGALTAFATFKKENYLKSIGIDSKMKRAVDQDLYYKMEEQGSHVFLDKVLYSYRVHEKSISNNENLYKAQYWHFYAMLKTYKRRKNKKMALDNFSRDYIRKYASNYYLDRFEKIKFSKKKGAQFYLLFKAISHNPWHKFEHKLKSLVVLMLGRI